MMMRVGNIMKCSKYTSLKNEITHQLFDNTLENVLNEIYAKSLEFGDNICTPVDEIVKNLYPNISNEDKINLADYIEQTKDSIEKYFYDNYDYKNEGTNVELQYKGEQWIKENYCWMNSENIKRAVSQGMYYAWHG